MSARLISKVTKSMLGTRIFATQLMAIPLVALLAVTTHYWREGGVLDTLLEVLGLIFIVVGAFGRLWASMYISGYKHDRMITCGPYSMVRHPLYLFSLVGVAGVGFASESLLVLGILLAAFYLYYPSVIAAEEEALSGKYGREYEEYARITPKLFPRFSLFREPDTYIVNVKLYRRAFIDASFFVLSFGALQLVEKMHGSGILPTLFRIP